MKTDKDQKSISVYEKALSMMILHNTKTDKIQNKYRMEYKLKKEAKE